MQPAELSGEVITVSGYELRTDRWYDPETHLWVQQLDGGRVRVGMDSLTAETSGSLAQLAMVASGTPVTRGVAFGSLEAAKFVGPMTSPVTGVLTHANDTVLTDPDLVLRSPYDDGWLAEIKPTQWAAEHDQLISGAALPAWFAQAVADYRQNGLVAE